LESERDEERKEEIAYISAVVAEQEAGGSWCSECGCLLDDYKDEYHEQVMRYIEWWLRAEKTGDRSGEPTLDEMRCPGCRRTLKYGGIYVPLGGSGLDF